MQHSTGRRYSRGKGCRERANLGREKGVKLQVMGHEQDEPIKSNLKGKGGKKMNN